jgi:hypothetical protein
MGHNEEITSETANVDERTLRIRALNDDLRQHFRGGSLLITSGIEALPAADRVAIITAVRKFDVRRDNQGARAATIRMRMRRWWADGRRA